MSRTRCLMSQGWGRPNPPSPFPKREGGESPSPRGGGVGEGFMNSAASQLSSSGCVGNCPCVPDSSSERAMPWPKKSFHSRLAATRAVSGFSGETVHFAKSSRV